MASASLDKEIFLPTFDRLGITQPPTNFDIHKVLTEWSPPFLEALSSNKVDIIISLFLKDGLWRDLLALTWDFRTVCGHDSIRHLLNARLEQTKIMNVRLSDNPHKKASLINPAPDLFMVQAFFDFETSIGLCSGIFRIVPTSTSNGDWKLHAVFTNLDELKGFPPKIGLRRTLKLDNAGWAEERAKEIAFEDREPTVLIIGGGQSGLEVAARLKYQGISHLVIEKNPRIGDNWRDRYDTLCLHDPVWMVHMPYMNFPSTWPVFTPAKKLADWMEAYAQSLDLDIWTSSQVISVQRDDAKEEWVATVLKSDGTTRIFHTKYIVLSFGFLGNIPKMPQFAGTDAFKGQILHSTQFKRAMDHKGKKVVVIGACNSGHDICQDLAHYGLDVTMVQRSSTCVISVGKALPYLAGSFFSEQGPPVEICDLINASFPAYLHKRFHQRAMPHVRELDKELREGLEKAGFKCNDGPDDAGFITMAWETGSGYHLDVGASQMIIDGKVKIKHSSVAHFVEDGLVFEDGSNLKADVVICATGFGDAHDTARKIFPSALVDKMKPTWGLTREGEMRGIFTECGLPNVYVMMGNLQQCRCYSTHIALQIQAKEEGLYATVYDG